MWEGGGGGRGKGGHFGSQGTGMIEWGQKSKPKKIPRASKKTTGPKINSPKSLKSDRIENFKPRVLAKKNNPSITPVTGNQEYSPGLVCCSNVCGALIGTTWHIYQRRVRQ